MTWLDVRRPSWPVLAGVLIGVVIVAGAAIGVWYWLDAQASRAATAYAEVLSRVPEARSRESTPQARVTAMSELEAVLARYPSAALAPAAAWELGNLRYDARDWPRARAAYEMALSRAHSATLERLARAAIGSTWEAEGSYARGLETYRTALAGLRPGDFLYDELLTDVGRMQELTGDKTAAIATYRQFLKELPKNPRVDDVRSHLAHLGAAAQ